MRKEGNWLFPLLTPLFCTNSQKYALFKNSILLEFSRANNISFQFRIFVEKPNLTSLKISVNRRNDVKFEFLFPENRDEILLTDFQSQCRQQGTNNMIKPLPNYPTR